jgi:hypothetical protein
MSDGFLINQRIFDAILMRHRLQFRTGHIIYVVEPHAYGITHDRRQVLWAWQTAGDDANVQAEWVLYQTDEMRDVQRLAETFEGPRPGYRRDNEFMREIHGQL